MDTRFCQEALEEALEHHGTPEIFNTDQSSQVTREAFTNKLKALQIRISMGGKGRWVDKSLWNSSRQLS